MRDLIVPVLAVLAMGALVYAIIGDAACQAPVVPPDAAPPPVDAAPPPPDVLHVLDARPIDAQPTELTAEIIERRGFIGVPAEWVDTLMDGRPGWTRDPRTPAPTFVNEAGVRVSFKIRGGRVQSVGAELPETALSADIKALGDFVVGNRGAVPLHIEPGAGETVKTRGSFEDADGRLWYYRVEMPQGREPPFTAETVEFAAEPFPGQLPGLDPPPPVVGVNEPTPDPTLEPLGEPAVPAQPPPESDVPGDPPPQP